MLMKVLHVITGLAAGGAESQLELLLRHTRHAAEVVTLYNFGSVGHRIAARGVRVYDLGMRGNRQFHSIFRLARIMRKGVYNVAHLHLYRACLYGRVAARLAGIPVVVTTEHSLGETLIEGRRKTLPVRLLYLATEPLSSATVAVSPKVRKLLVAWGVPEAKIRVIPNGLDSERFAFDLQARKLIRREFGIPEDGFVLGSVGRLHASKRYDHLLKAATPLLKGGVWLLLVGDGPERLRLAQLAQEIGAAQRLVFAGERDDVPRLLSAIDLFVSPSEEETFGLAILEAVASGLRVVAAECPALDGTGIKGVRRVSADVPSLSRALLEERSLGPGPRRAQSFPERYGIRAVAAAVDTLYESLLFARGHQSEL
jgi:glycosyltransferase involved in cell wall biosynthesis